MKNNIKYIIGIGIILIVAAILLVVYTETDYPPIPSDTEYEEINTNVENSTTTQTQAEENTLPLFQYKTFKKDGFEFKYPDFLTEVNSEDFFFSAQEENSSTKIRISIEDTPINIEEELNERNRIYGNIYPIKTYTLDGGITLYEFRRGDAACVSKIFKGNLDEYSSIQIYMIDCDGSEYSRKYSNNELFVDNANILSAIFDSFTIE